MVRPVEQLLGNLEVTERDRTIRVRAWRKNKLQELYSVRVSVSDHLRLGVVLDMMASNHASV